MLEIAGGILLTIGIGVAAVLVVVNFRSVFFLACAVGLLAVIAAMVAQ